MYGLGTTCSSPHHELIRYHSSLSPFPNMEEGLCEYDIYNASPSPLPSGTKKKQDPSGSQTRHNKKIEGKEWMEQNKKKLLEKVDWTGISIQQPIQLKYESVGNDKSVGRRRKISDGQVRQRGVRIQQRATSPFIRLINSRQITVFHAAEQKDIPCEKSEWGIEPRDEVRISIGGKPLHTGTGLKLPQHDAQTDFFQKSLGCPSDIMLLDEDGPRGEDAQHSSRGQELYSKSGFATPEESRAQAGNRRDQLASKTSSSHSSITSPCWRTTINGESDAAIGNQGSSSVTWTAGDRAVKAARLAKHTKRIRQSRKPPPGTKSFHGPPWSLCPADACESGLEVVHDEISIRSRNSLESSSYPSHLSCVGAHASNNAKGLYQILRGDSRMLIVRSSPDKLYHPRPQLARPKILDSDPLDIGSTVAELGAAQPIVPPSRAPDEEMWKGWINSLNDSDPEEPTELWGQREDCRSIYISPGISTLARRAEKNDHISSDIISLTPEPSCELDEKSADSGEQKEPPDEYSRGTKITKDSSPLVPTPSYRNALQPRPQAGILKPVDKIGAEEAAWKIFVCPDDDESEDEKQIKLPWRAPSPPFRLEASSGVKQPSRIPGPVCRLQTTPNSSLRVHICTETSIDTQTTRSDPDSIRRDTVPIPFISSSPTQGNCTSNHVTLGTIAPSSSPRPVPTRVPSHKKRKGVARRTR